MKFSINNYKLVESVEPRISPTCPMLTIVFTDGECMTHAFHNKDDMIKAYREIQSNME